MTHVAGMEGGSGDGTAASRKAGWLHGSARLAQPYPTPALPAGGSVMRDAAADLLQAVAAHVKERLAATSAPQPTPPRVPARPAGRAPALPTPTRSATGRPLPPDGSAPPPRPAAAHAPSAASNRHSGSAPHTTPTSGSPAISPGGNLPSGASHPSGAAAHGGPTQPHAAASAAPRRAAGAPLPAGVTPSAPAGHSYLARPTPAPPGEFRFAVRCSCGRERVASVTLDDLRSAAARGLTPAAAIATAQQDVLDAMHP